jgi:hypothetical protein
MKKTVTDLEDDITFYTKFAWVCVLCALAPLVYAGYVVIIESKYWQEADLGSFIGGVSGTLTALAGVFFVYVAFLGQRISIIQQQIELQDNRKELRETRKEIKGQKEQLKLQNKNLAIQSFENGFFELLRNLKSSIENSQISPHSFIHRINQFKTEYNKEFEQFGSTKSEITKGELEHKKQTNPYII